jgi:hypothetical protein
MSVAGRDGHRRIHNRRGHASTPTFPLHEPHPEVSYAKCVRQSYRTVAIVPVRAETINVRRWDPGVGTGCPYRLQDQHEFGIR